MLQIAIINHDFSGFSGSEIVTLEVANYFALRGGNVVIRAERFSDILTPYLHERVRVSPHRIEISKFDIIWSQHGHFALNTENLDDVKSWNGIFIAGHLSSTTPGEAYHYPFSAKYAGGIIFNAEQAEQDLIAKATPCGITCNFKNAAPMKFHKLHVTKSETLEKLLVVSNHLPDEVRQALIILKDMGITCEHIGQGGRIKLIDPDDISAADAVISIGKTVQYSLVGGCPVYCYDHFGGPGWLSASNFELAEKKNFSGRCSGIKKSAEQIVEELLNGYAAAKEFTNSRAPYFHKEYNLEAILDTFMEKLRISGIGNFFNSQDCIEDIDLMRGVLLHFGWIWNDVYGKEHLLNAELRVRELEKLNIELEDARLEAIRVLSTSWLKNLVLKPWQARKWNKLRKIQYRYKNEVK